MKIENFLSSVVDGFLTGVVLSIIACVSVSLFIAFFFQLFLVAKLFIDWFGHGFVPMFFTVTTGFIEGSIVFNVINQILKQKGE